MKQAQDDVKNQTSEFLNYASEVNTNMIQDEHYETEIILNSNLMITDFPHNMKIRLAPLKNDFVAS